MFVVGCPSLTISVDHKPLVKIFNDQNLEDVKNPRVREFKERMLVYNFKVVHVPGVKHLGLDAASRKPGDGDMDTSRCSCCTSLHRSSSTTVDPQ